MKKSMTTSEARDAEIAKLRFDVRVLERELARAKAGSAIVRLELALVALMVNGGSEDETMTVGEVLMLVRTVKGEP